MRELDVSKPRFTPFKAKSGGLDLSPAQQLPHLQDENHGLEKLVTDLSLGKETLKVCVESRGCRNPGRQAALRFRAERNSNRDHVGRLSHSHCAFFRRAARCADAKCFEKRLVHSTGALSLQQRD